MDADKSKDLVNQARDILEVMGQKNEHQGAKWTMYFNKLWHDQELEKDQISASRLKHLRRSKQSYLKYVLDMVRAMLKGCERPAVGYMAGAGMDGDNIYVMMNDRWGRVFKRGMKPCGIPAYDILAANTLAGSVEDTMWDIENKKVTDSGIHLS